MLYSWLTSRENENEPLQDVKSKEFDARFREFDSFIDDKDLLPKLAGGDLIALVAKYHNTWNYVIICVKPKIREEQCPFRSIKKFG